MTSRAGSIAIGVALGLLVVSFGVTGRADPLYHTQCSKDLLASEPSRWMPAAFVNSPYGGSAQVWAHGDGTGALNGTSVALMMEAGGVDLYRTWNSSVLGVGPNIPCQGSYQVALVTEDFYGITDGLIQKPSSLSDSGESGSFAVYNETSNLSAVVYLNNGFTLANDPNVSTCAGLPVTKNVSTTHVSIGIPFEVSGLTVVGPFDVPWMESYTYHFPANYGTWAVENLSAPGGPGGGWAFAFLGTCS